MLNNETLVFWVGGWAHCPDYAEAATGGVLYKKANLKNLAIFTGNTCVRVFLNKVAGLQAYSIIKKRLQYRCFSVNIGNF